MLQVAGLLVLCAAAGTARAADALAYRAEEPRAYGWRLGDIVTRRVQVDVPAGWVLDETSLPARGRGGALELRTAAVTPTREGFTLDLAYQVFVSPVEPRRIDLPTVALRFDPLEAPAAGAGAPAVQELRVQPWPLVVAPLVGDPAPSGRGFGEMRPDIDPPPLPSAPARRHLLWSASLAGLLAAVLALRPWVERWWWRRHRPFAVARRDVRQALQGGSANLEAALRHLHTGFNRHAGRVLMHDDARALVAGTPAWQPVAAAIDAFFTASRERFFGVGSAGAFDGAALQRLADDLAAIERSMPGAAASARAMGVAR